MKKNDFTEYPRWVRWIAQDESGVWWGFEVEPNLSHNGWYENELGRYVRLADGEPDRQWRKTLQAVADGGHRR